MITLDTAIAHYYEFWRELGRTCARQGEQLTAESAATDEAGDLLEEMAADYGHVGTAVTLFPEVAAAMYRAVDFHLCVANAGPTPEFKAFKAGFDEVTIDRTLAGLGIKA